MNGTYARKLLRVESSIVYLYAVNLIPRYVREFWRGVDQAGVERRLRRPLPDVDVRGGGSLESRRSERLLLRVLRRRLR